MPSQTPSLIAELREEVGDSLRSAAEYDRDGYQFFYLRKDVDKQYTRDELDDIFDDVVLETLRTHYLEQQFHGGAYQCSALGFEEMMVFQFVREDFQGLLVSIDKDCSIDLNAFFDICKEYT